MTNIHVVSSVDVWSVDWFLSIILVSSPESEPYLAEFVVFTLKFEFV